MMKTRGVVNAVIGVGVVIALRCWVFHTMQELLHQVWYLEPFK